jgi:hypothetical protein
MRDDPRVIGRYRATGADLPFADPRRAHGVAMEGYFWRFTDARAGRSIVALCGINRDADGRLWAIVGLAAHPGGFVRHAVIPTGGAHARGLGVWAGDGVFHATEHELHLDLGDDARLDVALDDVGGWRAGRAFGGLGIAHAVPGLGQYWHPHGLRGTATGVAVVDGERIVLDGARTYSEKNWSHLGFPREWWWGQAHCFAGADDDVCLAFAGGGVRVGGIDLTATAIVVRLGDDVLRFGHPLLAPVRVGVGERTWRLVGTSARRTIEVEGWAPDGEAHVLPVPLPHERRTVPGSLQHFDGRMRVVVRERGSVRFAGESGFAGLENGAQGRAEAEQDRRRRALVAA